MQYSLFSNPFSKYIYPIEFVRKLTCCLRETDVPGINSMRITTFWRGWVKMYFNICKLHPILDLLCRQPQLATRAVLIGTEIQKARRMFSEAALEFIRLTGEVRNLHLIISNCYHFFPPYIIMLNLRCMALRVISVCDMVYYTTPTWIPVI